MILLKYMRRLFKKEPICQPLAQVTETPDRPPVSTIPPQATLSVHEPAPSPAEPAVREQDIAFLPKSDLEAYVRELAVSKEAIERWISAGVLLPEETKVAAKMIRIMCRHDKRKIH